ncbi:diguanylate cyclase [Janthinobacterium sp.]|uniref:sensor domain-containing diguanylate cyclase n=1 Tax=Janthinobacterium sp. TaxID=1871054 RepID=UPI00293D775E|nr:diguanylate cyclase [Janthinobacterium sp.]
MTSFPTPRDLIAPTGPEDDGSVGGEREWELALAIECSGTGIWDRNLQSGEISYSPAWKRMFGYAAADPMHRIEDSYTRVHPDDLAMVQASIEAHLRGQTEMYEVQHRVRCKDGSYKWIVSRGKVVSRDAAGLPLRMTGITHDISAQMALAEQLRHSAELLTNLTDDMPGMVYQYLLGADGGASFPHASAGIAAIYELAPPQVRHSAAAVEALIHPEDLEAYRASLADSAAALTRWRLEYRVLLPAQGLRWRQGDAQPRRQSDGGTLWHGFISDITERKHIEAQMRQLATIDSLTGLPNRRHFMQRLEEQVALLARGLEERAVVLMIDLDHFKEVNDRYGHATGDLVLQHFAALLRLELRKIDAAGRIGGEEFTVILPGADAAAARAFGRRLQRRLERSPLAHGAGDIAVRVSIGVAPMRAGEAGVDAALLRADLALYRAKAGGRNRIELAPD